MWVLFTLMVSESNMTCYMFDNAKSMHSIKLVLGVNVQLFAHLMATSLVLLPKMQVQGV